MKRQRTTKPNSDHRLIAAVERGLRHYDAYQRLCREVEEAAGGPCDMPAHVERHTAQARRLFVAVRGMRASSVAGLAAKARLFAALDDPGGSGPEYAFGTDGIARSICRDVTTLAQPRVEGAEEEILIGAWRSIPQYLQDALLRLILADARRFDPRRAN